MTPEIVSPVILPCFECCKCNHKFPLTALVSSNVFPLVYELEYLEKGKVSQGVQGKENSSHVVSDQKFLDTKQNG